MDNVCLRTLSSLAIYLQMYSPENTIILQSIISCLTDLVYSLSLYSPSSPFPSSRIEFFKSLFWVVMGLIQIADGTLFTCSLPLMNIIIRSLDDQGAFKAIGLSATLSEHRETLFPTQSTALDAFHGIWFSADFSFAFSGHLMRGIKSPLTKEAAAQALTMMLEVAGRNGASGVDSIVVHDREFHYVEDHCIGFIIPLFPSNVAKASYFFKLSGLPEHLYAIDFANLSTVPGTSESGGSLWRQILDRVTPLSDENRAVLIICMMITMLEGSDCTDSEAAFIYGFLAEVTLEVPELMTMVYVLKYIIMQFIITKHAYDFF